MKLTKIELSPHYLGYGDGAEPGIKCEVEFQAAENYGSRFTVKLTDEQVKQVVQLAATLALDATKFDPETIDVVGKPGTPRPKPEVVADTPALEEVPL